MNSRSRDVRFRAFGQRPIVAPSAAAPSSGPRPCPAKSSNRGPCVSLSAFLDRKLQRAAVPAGTVQCKPMPFSMLVEPRDCVFPNDVLSGDKVGAQEVKMKQKEDADKLIFQQFKLTDKDKEDCAASCSLEKCEDFQPDGEVQESRKRRNPFQGENLSVKRVVILGKGLEAKPKGRKKSLNTKEKPRPQYNHYENGGGFWDSSMLGIDNDEVGFTEVWEGVGSTTLGGIEWH